MGPLERCWPTRRPCASGAEPCVRARTRVRAKQLWTTWPLRPCGYSREASRPWAGPSLYRQQENHMRTPSRKLAVLVVATGFAALPAWAVATPDRTAHRGPADHHGHYGNYGHHGHHGHHRSAVLPAAVFLPKSAAGNRFEIVTGQLAQQRAQSDAVKSLGAMFVTDHTAALQQVTQVAATLGISLPAGLDPMQQAIVERLQTLTGAEFDAAW